MLWVSKYFSWPDLSFEVKNWHVVKFILFRSNTYWALLANFFVTVRRYWRFEYHVRDENLSILRYNLSHIAIPYLSLPTNTKVSGFKSVNSILYYWAEIQWMLLLIATWMSIKSIKGIKSFIRRKYMIIWKYIFAKIKY